MRAGASCIGVVALVSTTVGRHSAGAAPAHVGPVNGDGHARASDAPPAGDTETNATDVALIVSIPHPVVRLPTSWTVEPGESFWSIAADSLADAWQRAPTDLEVANFWADVVAANEDRLVVPGEPDLLWPGQVLVVPAPPALPHHSVG
ncbi:MAG: LysM peptidoglycan-binding domain-containing protein [Acidimicrobiales bacterium]|nr:LysM peptidoglycan-binding domain-containing protein [Acidimicrobiales bacterium]